MKSLRIDLSDEVAEILEKAADRIGIEPQELIRISLEEKLAQLDHNFVTAAEYVLRKNAELYRRLA